MIVLEGHVWCLQVFLFVPLTIVLWGDMHHEMNKNEDIFVQFYSTVVEIKVYKGSPITIIQAMKQNCNQLICLLET